MEKTTITIARKRLALILIGIAALLCITSITLKFIEWELSTNSTYWYYQTVRLFNVNRETSIPTWYSTLLLLSSAVLLAITAYSAKMKKGRYIIHWWLLALIFTYLSIDEAAAIHEKFTIYFQENLNLTGHLYFGWLLVGIPFALIVGLIYLKFLLHLPMQTRLHFIFAATLYVGGAIAIESISSNLWYLNDGTSLEYSAVGTVEEFFEMSGVILFIYGLLTYISENTAGIEVRIKA